MHGRGTTGSEAKSFALSWAPIVDDINRAPTPIPRDNVNGSSPLISELNLKKYADAINCKRNIEISFKQPNCKATHKFSTYISEDLNHSRRPYVIMVSQETQLVAPILSVWSHPIDKNETLETYTLHC